MKPKLCALLIEDNPYDVKLLQKELNESFEVDLRIVKFEDEYRAALESGSFDLIISDFFLADFNGLDALIIFQKYNLNIPFILVTGSINEETAVRVIKHGADDYILKEHLERLAPAIQSAIDKRLNLEQKLLAEKKLHESHEFNLTLLQTIPFGMDIVDQNGIILFANDQIKERFGIDVIGKRCWEVYHDEKKQCVACPLFKPIEIGQTKTVQVDKMFDGRVFEMTHTGLNFGGKKALLEIFQDVTEQKKQNEALRLSEERFKFVLQNSPVVIWNQDKDLKYNWIYNPNKNFDQNSLLGKTDFDLLNKRDAETVTQLKFKVLTTGTAERQEMEFLINNEIFHYDLSVEPTRDENGEVNGIACVGIDITSLRKSEEKINQLSLAVEQNPASIVITNKNGVIEYVNPKFTTVSGYDAGEVVGKNIRVLKAGLTARELYQELWETILRGETWRGEFLNKKKTGELFWESASISSIKNKRGEITRFIAVKEDITEKKKMIEELIAAKETAEEMNAIKASFFANMSHELRTPLIGILGYSEILSDEFSGDENVQSMIEGINKGGKRLLETLNLILNITKLEAGKTSVNYRAINIIPLLEEIFYLNTSFALKNGIECNLKILAKEIYCKIDTSLFGSIFNNLVSNAVKYTSKGKVELHAEANDGRAVIRVIDTGIGIPEEKQEIVWEEFRQASEGLGRIFEGTGLGLTIAKKYTELMDGKISLESKVGEGSCFTVSFPIAQREIQPADLVKIKESTQVTPPIQKEVAPKKKKRILFVDDDEIAKMFVRRVLSEEFNVDCISAVEEALALIEANEYNLILMDLNLGAQMNGLELAKKIKSSETYNDVPIVAVTAYAMIGDRERALANGLDGYIAKPFRINDFYNFVKGWVKD